VERDIPPESASSRCLRAIQCRRQATPGLEAAVGILGRVEQYGVGGLVERRAWLKSSWFSPESVSYEQAPAAHPALQAFAHFPAVARVAQQIRLAAVLRIAIAIREACNAFGRGAHGASQRATVLGGLAHSQAGAAPERAQRNPVTLAPKAAHSGQRGSRDTRGGANDPALAQLPPRTACTPRAARPERAADHATTGWPRRALRAPRVRHDTVGPAGAANGVVHVERPLAQVPARSNTAPLVSSSRSRLPLPGRARLRCQYGQPR